MPEFQLENVGLTEAVAEADPSTPSDPPVTGISPVYFNCINVSPVK